MAEKPYPLISAKEVFAGMAAENAAPKTTGNGFFDYFTALVHRHGNHVNAGTHAHLFVMLPLELNAAVRALTGRTAHEWALDYCVYGAMDLLLRTDWKIPQIAERLGFGSTSAFGHFFKARHGISATWWRYRHREREIVQPEIARFRYKK